MKIKWPIIWSDYQPIKWIIHQIHLLRGEWHIFGKRRSGREHFQFSSRRDGERKRKPNGTGPVLTPGSSGYFHIFGTEKKWRFLSLSRPQTWAPVHWSNTPNPVYVTGLCTCEFPRSKSWYNGWKRSNQQFDFRSERELSVPVRRGLRRENENYCFDLWSNFNSFYTVR
jgi:hypothetical protein